MTEYINLDFHHGGVMDFSGDSPKYVGGFSEKFKVDVDEVSYFGILSLCTGYLNYYGVRKMWYLTPGATMAEGLHEIMTDKEIMEGLLVDTAQTKEVSLFVDCVEADDGLMGDNDTADNIARLENDDDYFEVGEYSVAKEIMHVADSSDEESSEKQNHLPMVNSPDSEAGEEVDQPMGDDGDMDEEEDDGDYILDEDEEDGEDEVSVSAHRRTGLLDEEPAYMFDDLSFYDPDCDHKALEFTVGMMFLDVEDFKKAISNHVVAAGASVWCKKSDESRREYRYKDQNCSWRVYVAWWSGNAFFIVRRVGLPHSCTRSTRVNLATARFIAEHFLERFKSEPDWKAPLIAMEVKRELGVDVELKVCYTARAIAKEMLCGTLEQEYNKLRRYVAALIAADPEGRFELEVEPDVQVAEKVHFKRFYVGFSRLRKGFLAGCRPNFSIDGCFLKGEVPGMLLTAVGKDGNSHIYPFAWAVVEGENKSSWKWFLEHLQEELGFGDGVGWSVVSDQQKGLVEAINLVMPSVEHRKCVRHVFANWKVKVKNEKMRKIYWEAVYAFNVPEYETATTKMEAFQNAQAVMTPFSDFMEQDPKSFCRAFLSRLPKSDFVESNICESWNNVIVKAREYRIIAMLEAIRGYIMVQMRKKRKKFEKMQSVICPAVMSTITVEDLKARM
ncbi:unnamed protein product [Linum trigynum]|uniref:Transposase n=1 Tax=Linum trigynum TaxID=586398 RepID=A0AAV2GV49_9ROSI